ncbi:MAG TPA: bifunctional DNA-formamidopyrimidine glycosylase/DNA-(apurinic or apyrimidinic site) lyase [Thermodesulfobacteriota bacterium]|nr:bifunctional DNA-formamidopyrimidine glycosylase/DNA-(apurinic or apyrimidinic site) lyase [Thermodesulfobacteriota bacterium]
MPELPEVETIVRGLRERVTNLRFSGVEVRLEKCIRGARRSLVRSIRKRKVLDIDRRGKNIVFRLSGEMFLFIHLGMSGRLRMVRGAAPLEKHTQVIFSFQDHPHQLRFIDPRQFGRLFWEKRMGGELIALSHLGPEPLGISSLEFSQRVRNRHREIKPLLLDQHFLAGVGNIYADESLHRAGIHPRRKSDSLTEKALFRLHRALQEVLRESILAKGTSVRSYVDASGSTGAFQNSLRVYGREGEPCMVCGRPIIRERVGGRSSFFCPRCQRPLRGRPGGGSTPLGENLGIIVA